MSQKPPAKHDLTPAEQRKEKWRKRSLQLLRVLEWVLWLLLGVVVVSSLTVGGVLFWLSKSHQQSQPLNLDPWLPRVEKLAAAQGVALHVDHLETYFDGGVVLHAEGVQISGPVVGGGTEPGLVIEEVAVRLSNRRLFAFEVSPKKIEARGVTLKLRLHDKQLQIAGLLNTDVNELPPLSVVNWLNSLPRDATWGALKKVTVGGVTLLFQDDDHKAGWVLEQGQAKIKRQHGVGESLQLDASLRQLYGKAVLVSETADTTVSGTVAVPSVATNTAGHPVQAMPVVLRFDHPRGSDKATLNLTFSKAQLGLVEGYLPPEFAGMICGSGTVGLQTTLDSNDRIEEPGVDLHLHDVTIAPPSAYSHPLSFSRLDVLATYLPSPTDILEVRRVEGVYGEKTLFRVRGDVRDIEKKDPLINLSVVAPGGNVADVIDFLPDEKVKEAVAWLRANLKGGTFTDLRGRYTGRPSAMPDCGELCGISVDANMQKMAMTFLKGLPEAEEISGTLSMRGKTVTIDVPSAKIGQQTVHDANVRVTDLFEPKPVRLLVNAGISGDAGELMKSLLVLAKSDLPLKLSGVQSTTMALNIPLPKGRDADIAEMGILATTRLTKAKLEQAPYLPGSFATDSTTIVVGQDRRVRIASTGTLLAETEKDGGKVIPVPAQLQISDTLEHFGSALEIAAKGTVPGSWLGRTMQVANYVSLTGPVGVDGTLQKLPDGWGFDVAADGGQLAVTAPAIKWQKAKDTPLKVQAKGAYHEKPAMHVQLANLKVQGGTAENPLETAGSLEIWPDQFGRSSIALQPLRLGRNDLSVQLKNQTLNVTGKQLDISQFDLIGSKSQGQGGVLMKEKPATQTGPFDRLAVNLAIQKILAQHGVLSNVAANLQNTAGKWNVNRLQAEVDKGGRVNMTQQPLGNGGKQVNIAVENTGQVLATLGVYDALKGGNLKGQINYSTPTRASGKLVMTDYELKNPPLLAKLLALLSLQQLLAGTDTILFRTADVPLKMDGDLVWLDNAQMIGPTMSLQLDGSLDRGAGQLDMRGKVSPAIPFNRLVAQIPLLGKLLAGSQDGLIAADFKLKGSTDDPKISVSPLSVITPGLVKDIWHDLTTDKPAQFKDGK